MKYPIEIYRRKQNQIIVVLWSLFIAGFGIICVLVAFDLYKNTNGFIETLGQIILFLFGLMMLLVALAHIFIKPDLDRPTINIDAKGVTINQFIKVGPIDWQDITEIKVFDNPAPNSYGLQRIKGIDIKIGNQQKYISLAKKQNKGLFVSLKIFALTWLYFGKIKVSSHAVDIELEDLNRILHHEHKYNKTRVRPQRWKPQATKIF